MSCKKNMYVIVQESGYYSDYNAETIEVHATFESASRSIKLYETNPLLLEADCRYKIQEVPIVDIPEDGFEHKLSLHKELHEARKAKVQEDEERRQRKEKAAREEKARREEKATREAEEKTARDFLNSWKDHKMTFEASDLDRYKDTARVIHNYALWSGDKEALDWCRMVGKIW